VSNDIIVKKGEQLLTARLRRSSRGITLHAKAHSSIEEYFSSMSKAEPLHVNNWQRGIWNKFGEYPELLVYGIDDKTASAKTSIGTIPGSFSVAYPGFQLLLDQGTKSPTINMSWLRLKGISSDLGVAFSIKGAFTSDEVNNLSEMVYHSMKRFYLEYLKPVDVTITMSKQENLYL
jgi:hypothetical protein